MLAALEELDDLLDFGESTMRMERHEASTILDIIVLQELPSHTSILAGDIVCFFEDTECPESDIFEITDGGGDDGEQEDKR